MSGVKVGLGLSLQYGAWGGTGVPTPLQIFAQADFWGYYRADLGSNSQTTWTDASGNSRDLTQSTPALPLVLGSGYGGRACYNTATNLTIDKGFSLPAIAIDKQAHSWWCVARLRSIGKDLSRCFTSFNTGLTDLMTEISNSNGTYPAEVRVWNSGVTYTHRIGRSDLALILVSAGTGGVTLRYNGDANSLAAYSSGTVTGGTLFMRVDSPGTATTFGMIGETYEFGLLKREMTADDITALETYYASRYRVMPSYGNLHIIGDSLTEGQDCALCWPTRVDESIGLTWQQISEAQAGAFLSYWATNAAKSAAAYRSDRTKNIAVCFAGTNDLGSNGDTAAQVLTSLDTWATAMQGAGYTVLACTLIARDDSGWDATKETRRTTYNSTLLANPATYHCNGVIDLAALSAFSNPSNTTYYQSDKLHLKDAAQAVIATAVQAAVVAA